MRFNSCLKILVAASCIVLCSACSTTKHASGTTREQQGVYGAQTEGVGSESGFDEHTANKPKIANQIYYFDFDKFDVHQEDIDSIKMQAAYLLQHRDARVRLEGNADERGSREYNVILGWRRAKALNAILQQEGVLKDQIVLISYGKEKPAAFGHDEESYRLNRRVNLIYESM